MLIQLASSYNGENKSAEDGSWIPSIPSRVKTLFRRFQRDLPTTPSCTFLRRKLQTALLWSQTCFVDPKSSPHSIVMATSRLWMNFHFSANCPLNSTGCRLRETFWTNFTVLNLLADDILAAAPSNISLLLTFWWTGLWHFEHHTPLPVPFVSAGDIVCCVTLQNRCQTEGKWPTKLIFKEFSTGTNQACMHGTVFSVVCPNRTMHFCLFLYFRHHIKVLCEAAVIPRLQTREL